MGTSSKVTLFIDRSLITDAFLVCLHQHANNEQRRPLRLLTESDIFTIMKLEREMNRRYYAAKREVDKVDYKALRNQYLDTCRATKGWSEETRNLYASILSIIQNWKNAGGRTTAAQALLANIKPGADLLLRYLLQIQLELPLEQ